MRTAPRTLRPPDPTARARARPPPAARAVGGAIANRALAARPTTDSAHSRYRGSSRARRIRHSARVAIVTVGRTAVAGHLALLSARIRTLTVPTAAAPAEALAVRRGDARWRRGFDRRTWQDARRPRPLGDARPRDARRELDPPAGPARSVDQRCRSRTRSVGEARPSLPAPARRGHERRARRRANRWPRAGPHRPGVACLQPTTGWRWRSARPPPP